MTASSTGLAAVVALLLAAGRGGAQVADADSLFAVGRLAEARDAYARRLRADPSDRAARARLGLLALWANHPGEADTLLARVVEEAPDDRTSLEALAEARYRQGRIAEAAPLYRRLGRAAMAARAGSLSDPYRTSMPAGGVRLAFAPGTVLPVLTVEMNGRKADVLLDTGAGETIVDPAFAETVGTRSFGTDSAAYAAGAVASFQQGILDSLALGGIVVRNVPIHIRSTAAFAPAAGGRTVSGILGTGLLSRFRATLDFQDASLTLERPGHGEPIAGDSLRFWLLGDHFVTLRATVAGIETLLVLDTGLAMPGGALVPSTALLAEAGVDPGGASVTGVGGGGSVTVTPFTLDGPMVVGSLERRGVLAAAGAFPPTLERRFGPRIGGLLSHGFFTDRRVTLDFEGMHMIVGSDTGPATPPLDPGSGRSLTPTEVALEVIRLLRSGPRDSLAAFWSDDLLDRLPPDVLGQAWDGVVASLGPVTEVLPAEPGTGEDGRRFVKVPVRFGGVLLGMTVFFDDTGSVTGVAMQPG